MSPQVRTEIEETIESLEADNFDGAHTAYIAWLQSELDAADAS